MEKFKVSKVKVKKWLPIMRAFAAPDMNKVKMLNADGVFGVAHIHELVLRNSSQIDVPPGFTVFDLEYPAGAQDINHEKTRDVLTYCLGPVQIPGKMDNLCMTVRLDVPTEILSEFLTYEEFKAALKKPGNYGSYEVKCFLLQQIHSPELKRFALEASEASPKFKQSARYVQILETYISEAAKNANYLHPERL